MDRKYINKEMVRPDAEPNWILRRGQNFVVLVFILAVVLASFFSFNEIIIGKVKVTSKFPPAEIIAKQQGKLMELHFQPGDMVKAGAVLALIENSANAGDVNYLKEQLTNRVFFETIDSLKLVFPTDLRLGNLIQPSYQYFLSNYQEVILEKIIKNNELIQFQLKDEVKSQKRIAANKTKELLLADRSFELQERNLERHRELLKKGVISHHDLEKVENEFLAAQQKYEIITQQIEQVKIDLSTLEKDRKLAESSHFRTSSKGAVKLEAAREALLSNILNWEEKYLLVSPIEGKLSFNNVWGNFQNVEEGELVFVVMPLNSNSVVGRCKVPVRNSGKIVEGQSAYLKLDNYPYREWGILKGKVESISDIPSAGSEDYLVFLSIDSLTTSYGKELKFNRELIGDVEILLEETSIIERIFYEFRHLWSLKEY